MWTGLVKLGKHLISKTPVNPGKCLKISFHVMAYIHFLKEQTTPFASCELDPLKVNLESGHPFGIPRLKAVALKLDK